MGKLDLHPKDLTTQKLIISTADGVVPYDGRKVSPYIIIVQIMFSVPLGSVTLFRINLKLVLLKQMLGSMPVLDISVLLII